MTSCPRCGTEMIVKGGHPDFEGDLEGQTMHYACPVCQGTPEEFNHVHQCYYHMGLAHLIAARDAAKKAEGRLEGLKEAEGICQVLLDGSWDFDIGRQECAEAIRAAMEAE